MTATARDDTDPLRVGVTGHRDLAAVDDVTDQVRRALDDVIAARPDGTILEVWSSLAEGADRIVAACSLARPNARLAAVLPLDADEYRRDFLTPASRDEFDALLARAASIEVITFGATQRFDAYLTAARIRHGYVNYGGGTHIWP